MNIIEKRRERFLRIHPDPLERLFIILVTTALSGLFFVLVMTVILGGTKEHILILFTGQVVLSIIAAYTIKSKKIQLGASVATLLITFVFIPVLFFRAGGIRGGVPLWFLFSTLFISFILQGRLKIVMLVANTTEALACYLIAYFRPDLVIEIADDMKAYQASFISMLTINIIMILMISFEINTLKRETERSKEQQKEISELNAAQNRFFSSMSHEIRTPINTIIGLNEMILREDTSEEVAENAASIRSASEILLHLINDILDMSKLESGQMTLTPTEYDLGKLLSDISDMLRGRAEEKGLAFHIAVTDDIPAILIGDDIRIEQILINLLNNAIKYTKEGSVTLSVQCEHTDDEHILLSFSVTDTGMGIKPESIPHLFTAFKRVDEDQNRYIEGTGLGLSIVKQFVDLMGGKITVNSIYTKGSTFLIEIPQGVADSTAVLDPHRSDADTHYHQSFEAPQAQILIVDDDRYNLMVAKKLLRDTKVKVDTAGSGEEALEMTLQKRYHAILMDHMMPEMDGITCMHRIREQIGGLCQDTPVAALTANAGSDMKALYEKEGFDGYLLKPTGGAALESELLHLLPPDLIVYLSPDKSTGGKGSLENEARKRAVVFTTESTADLPRDMIHRLRIETVSHRVRTNVGLFSDETEIDTKGLMDYLERDPGNKAQSCPPEPSDYVDMFSGQLRIAKNVIHIATSSRIDSKNYDIACNAARSFNNVWVVDSGSISAGQGFLVMEAARLANEGWSAEMISKEMGKIRSCIHTSFLVNDIDYIARAGFISYRSAHLLKGMMVHPVVRIFDGRIVPSRSLLGTRDYVRKLFIKRSLFSIPEIDLSTVFVIYAGIELSELEQIKADIRSLMGFEQIICVEACPKIAISCGSGTFGISYMTKF